MRRKLALVFFIILAFLGILVAWLAHISVENSETYKRIVLSQQESSNTTLPFRRGDIVDSKGTLLATSTDVYNVVLDCSVVTADEDYLEPTLSALSSVYGLDSDTIRKHVEDNPDDMYYVLKTSISYEEMENFENYTAIGENDSTDTRALKSNIKGVWFEKEYTRSYPNGSLAGSLIGFVTSGNQGLTGLEEEYNDTLNGIDGREYGYETSDSYYQETVIEPTNGKTIVSTIDINLQSIIEKSIKEYNAKMEDGDENKAGATDIGVIMMDPNTGAVLAMANYPEFDLNDPWNTDVLVTQGVYTEEELASLDDSQKQAALDELWQNFCITYTYEPGSTAKTFTIATGLETGTLTGDETYFCDGGEHISGYDIACVNKTGHGTLSVKGALEQSCNDALMQMSYVIGASNFSRYQQIFNFGLKTNIDLPGEMRTDSLLYSEEDITKINLATNAFGQNFNCTMIQVASAYCSVVNGGNYYQPHVVERIEDEDGNLVEEIEPVLLKKTISEKTSETLRDYLRGVVDEGTGSTAKVEGYSMGGKTGTAEMYDENGVRWSGHYVVSLIGNVPADDPELVIYVVINQPDTEDSAHSSFAQEVAKSILEEALPYLGIYPDENAEEE